MRITITHTTTYSYDAPVERGLQELRLWPSSSPSQDVITWRTELTGATREVMFEDQFANRAELVSLTPGSTSTTITASGEVITTDTAGVLSRHDGFTPLWLYERPTPRTAPGMSVHRLADSISGSSAEHRDDIGRLHELSAAVRSAIGYTPDSSNVGTTAEEALETGSGVCQDHAHAFIACARRLGYPARYVSGYLAGEDAEVHEASHAWADSWVENLGWVGFDVTNGIAPDERYVRLAVGLDYDDAAPIAGLRFGTGAEALDVTVEVQQQ